MKFPYKTFPRPNGGSDWAAILKVRISNPGKHSPPTPMFEALLDSGASETLFHSGIAQSIGIKLANCEQGVTSGISGNQCDVYYHSVKLYVESHAITIKAGFTDSLPIAALLGRYGFFEHFKVTFDPSSNPPGFEIDRVNKA